MFIGDRLRELREQKKMKQSELQKQTGLERSYISRVENGHTVPAIDTLERFARALEVPMYQLFYDGEEPPKPPHVPKRIMADGEAFGSKGREARWLAKLRKLLIRTTKNDRKLVMLIVQRMVEKK